MQAIQALLTVAVMLFGFEGAARYAPLAQLVERLPCKQDVSGSSPLTGTNTTGKGILPYGAWLKCIECSYRCDEVQLFEATRR